MNIFLVFVGLSVVLAQTDDISWNSFQVKNKKMYATQTELQIRQKIFNENIQKIEEHNRQYERGRVSYKLGINKFADLSDEEFASRFKTLEVDERILRSGQENYDLTNIGNKKLPETIDWRTKSAVTEVKNQESCGGCWAFSATGTIEGQIAIQTGELKSLSEQQLLDCDTTRNNGCNGGVVQYAINYVTQNGLTLGKNYPFQGTQQTCINIKSNDDVVWTKGYVNINRNNETDLKAAVGLVGPVSVAINAGPIKSYQEGIFDDTCSPDLTHGVLAVGYGKDATTGLEYWILKNSWGEDWGEQGYFKMRMGSNLCGVAKQACYSTLIPRSQSNSAYSIKGGLFLYLVIFVYVFLLTYCFKSLI